MKIGICLLYSFIIVSSLPENPVVAMTTGTLFLVGAGLTIEELKKVGVRSLLVSVILWIIITIVSLAAISMGIWHISPEILK